MAVLLGVRFVAELGMLACLGLAGWRLGDSWPTSLGVAVVLPLAGAVAWGRWVAPRASRRLSDPARLMLEVALFGATLVTVLLAEPARWLVVLVVAVCAAFLVSIPARRHEPGPVPPATGTGAALGTNGRD
ncbi:DUF2568 domain-containing protein [Nostocoides sp. F2B08]|uniref:YrdB family protein n=1 Tax=Nostocoides sp. F2B08 TaxID=2653936 RepID=UPI0012634F8C|nr:YrdB family protein [Tetrasphaera sp. F2B08]KAB7744278.1 DUF2568 domain-containing protein [Tetrasphaera sp. F2B08]